MSIEQRVKQGAHRTERSGWFDIASRAGFVARGAIYAVIGVFSLRLAWGDGGACSTAGARRARWRCSRSAAMASQ